MTITHDDDLATGIEAEEADRPVTADIVDVFPGACKVLASEIRIGDHLYDAFGGTHEVLERRRRGQWVDTVRHDGWTDRFHHTDIITIQRGVL